MTKSELTPEVDAIGDEFPAPEEVPRRRHRRQPPDPGYTGARLMLLAAIPDRRLRDRLGGQAIAAVIEVWTKEWLEPLATAWRLEIRNRERQTDGEHPSAVDAPGPWLEFVRDGAKKTHKPDQGNGIIASAVWKQRAIVGFSTEPVRYLPSSLMRIAEYRFVVGPMDADVFGKIVRSMTGKRPSADTSPGLLAKLTPDILRLAWRPGVKADVYVARLTDLTAPPEPAAQAGPALEDLHGMVEAVAWAKATIRDFDDYRARRICWKDMRRGLLLFGPPGVGKTVFAAAFARSANLPLVATSFAQWQGSGTGHLGDVLKAMQDSFAAARAAAPSVLFIDELDAIGDRAASHPHHRDYWTACVTGLLEQLDGIAAREGVMVIGATNNPSVLDPAVLRSGRLDHMIEVGLPDHGAIAQILRVHLGGDLAGEDLSDAARLAFGGTGADCAKYVRGARQRARHLGRPVQMDDLLDAIGFSSGDPAEERRTAVHEAGHAVATTLLRPGKLVGARIGRGIGPTGTVTVERGVGTTREAVRTELLENLAGRGAEEILLGEASGGSGGGQSSDLATATCLAVILETTLGLGHSKLVWLGPVSPETVGPMLALRPALMARISGMLDEIYAEAMRLVSRHADAVAAVADDLILRRSLNGEEISEIVSRHPPRDALPETVA